VRPYAPPLERKTLDSTQEEATRSSPKNRSAVVEETESAKIELSEAPEKELIAGDNEIHERFEKN
jgi:hypothetical protein